MESKERIPPFSVILIFVAFSVVGILCARHLSVNYIPKEQSNSIAISFNYPEASAKVVEESVTSKIEAALSGLRNSVGVSSRSSRGSGSIDLTFRNGTDMKSARLEVSTRLRALYPSLPKGISYPDIYTGRSDADSNEIFGIQLTGDFSSESLYEYASEKIVKPLSHISGVDKIDINGNTPFQWEVEFDSKAVAGKIVPEEIASAIREYFAVEELGFAELDSGEQSAIYLSSTTIPDDFDLGSIPIKNVGGRVIFLSDIANVRYVESPPSSYYRINGLNTISITFSAADNSNSIKVAEDIRLGLDKIAEEFPPSMSYSIEYDNTTYIKNELRKIWKRTLLSLLILLLFIFVIYRSFRYMVAVAISMAVNILVAIGLYYIFGLQINLYSLAGITISLGMIIDATIVMSDHFRSYANRAVIVAISGAIATTVISLVTIFLIPYNERLNLTDFVVAVAINLSVSLLVSYFFVPALLSYFATNEVYGSSRSGRRNVAKWSRVYEKYLTKAPRYKWLYILVLVAGVGIPTCMIPSKSDLFLNKDVHYSKFVMRIAEWGPYARNKMKIDRIVSSSFGLFYKSLDRINLDRTNARPYLSIFAGLSEGHTVAQLDALVRDMEVYLSNFSEIDFFRTRVNSYADATIQVYFKKEYEGGYAPRRIKAQVIKGATNFGGANWIISGIDDTNFNNFVGDSGYDNAIDLYGYDYDELIRYAENLRVYLEKNPRVRSSQIRSRRFFAPRLEYNISYNNEFFMLPGGVTPYSYFRALNNELYSSKMSIPAGKSSISLELRSADKEKFDLWHVQNNPIKVDSSAISLSQVGTIVKMRSDNDIIRENQSYKVLVTYNFVGDVELNKRNTANALAYMNGEVLPPGYKAAASTFFLFSNSTTSKYLWLIFVIIAVIYVMLCIMFESFRLPLAVMFLIPLSFIGFFLTFGLSSLVFDTGGLAALILLCGIVVNAGIYLLWDYKRERESFVQQGRFASDLWRRDVKCYLKSYNHKIRPIALTIISTILGLVPFLADGPKEAFWFDFAIGTISGLLFSIIALLLFLPVFVIRRRG